jgi:hypothetical protein
MDIHCAISCLHYLSTDTKEAFARQGEEHRVGELFSCYFSMFFRNDMVTDLEKKLIGES